MQDERVQWTGGSVLIYRWVLRLLGVSNNLTAYHTIPLLATDDDTLKGGRANPRKNYIMSRNYRQQQQQQKKNKRKENRSPWKLKPVILLRHVNFRRQRRGCVLSSNNKCQETHLLTYNAMPDFRTSLSGG